MQWARWNWLAEFRRLWEPPLPDPTWHAARIYKAQRNIVMPAKLLILAVVFWYVFYSDWMAQIMEDDTASACLEHLQLTTRLSLPQWTMIYLLFNVGLACFLWITRKFPFRRIYWIVLINGFVDGLFLMVMTVVTGGFKSYLFWVFPALIVVNAFSIPLAAPQIILNLSLSAFYMTAGIWNVDVINWNDSRANQTSRYAAEIDFQNAKADRGHSSSNKRRRVLARENNKTSGDEVSRAAFMLQLSVMWLLTGCCYGLQVLSARQKQIEEEAREFTARQGQLQTAGRLAAEIAHQIKNPLAIINNTTFSLRRALAKGKTDVAEQLDIIQEEVERSDRIITQIMGYARLAEGRVEKMTVPEEIDRALDEVFPHAVGFEVKIDRDFAPDLPPLLMQRGHLSAVLVNLLQNAREAMGGHGKISVSARTAPGYAVEIVIQDDGPGISTEQTERIFEAYFTTKEKGTGLGLAIVKHNVDLYGGKIRVESALGKGCRFVLVFPAKTLVSSQKNFST